MYIIEDKLIILAEVDQLPTRFHPFWLVEFRLYDVYEEYAIFFFLAVAQFCSFEKTYIYHHDVQNIQILCFDQ